MKNRFESAEVFSKYAELEAIDYLMRVEKDRLMSSKPNHPLERMIDEATGFGVSQDLESIDTIKDLLAQRIKCERFLEIDSTEAEEFLGKLNSLESELKSDCARISR